MPKAHEQSPIASGFHMMAVFSSVHPCLCTFICRYNVCMTPRVNQREMSLCNNLVSRAFPLEIRKGGPVLQAHFFKKSPFGNL